MGRQGDTPKRMRFVRRPPVSGVLVGSVVIDPRAVNQVKASRQSYIPGVERLQAGMISCDVVNEVQDTHKASLTLLIFVETLL